jgi:hypothetical protein
MADQAGQIAGTGSLLLEPEERSPEPLVDGFLEGLLRDRLARPTREQ